MPATSSVLERLPRAFGAAFAAGDARAQLTVVPPPPVAPKIEWRRAWRAVRRLMANPDETEQAFEAIAALSGRDWERLFVRFASHPEGRALLAERRSLLATLSDRARLEAMPPGS